MRGPGWSAFFQNGYLAADEGQSPWVVRFAKFLFSSSWGFQYFQCLPVGGESDRKKRHVTCRLSYVWATCYWERRNASHKGRTGREFAVVKVFSFAISGWKLELNSIHPWKLTCKTQKDALEKVTLFKKNGSFLVSMLDFREVDPFFQRSHWGPQKGPISTIADDFWTFEIHNWKETIQGQLASISFASFFVCLFVCFVCWLVGLFVSLTLWPIYFFATFMSQFLAIFNSTAFVTVPTPAGWLGFLFQPDWWATFHPGGEVLFSWSTRAKAANSKPPSQKLEPVIP